MKKKFFTPSLIILFMVVLLGSQANKRKVDRPDIPSVKLPDLTASIEFTKVTKYTNYKGVTCYSLIPTLKVINKGKAWATNFNILVEWNINPTHTWSTYSKSDKNKLAPKTSRIICDGPACEIVWCINEKWIPAWRITVDIPDNVFESNEDNNQVIKKFIIIKKIKSITPR